MLLPFFFKGLLCILMFAQEFASYFLCFFPQRIRDSLDVGTVLRTLDYFHKKKDDDDVHKKDLDDNCERAMFTAFHILVILQEKATIPQKDLDNVVQLMQSLPQAKDCTSVGELVP